MKMSVARIKLDCEDQDEHLHEHDTCECVIPSTVTFHQRGASLARLVEVYGHAPWSAFDLRNRFALKLSTRILVLLIRSVCSVINRSLALTLH